MFIQTETTPNPLTLKFIPGETVLLSGTAEYRCVEEAAVSPLARRVFDVGGVAGVFLGRDFIAVTRDESRDWNVLKPIILGAIMDHYTSGDPAVSDSVRAACSEEDDDIVIQIKEILETRVRPVVAQDGGDIVFHQFKNGIVYLALRGACSGCPSSAMTLKHGVENLLRHFVPEVKAVEAVETDF